MMIAQTKIAQTKPLFAWDCLGKASLSPIAKALREKLKVRIAASVPPHQATDGVARAENAPHSDFPQLTVSRTANFFLSRPVSPPPAPQPALNASTPPHKSPTPTTDSLTTQPARTRYPPN